MTLRFQLQAMCDELATFHDEQDDRFDQTLFAIRHAHELAIKHHAADAAKIVENVTARLSPIAGRRLLVAMISALPAESNGGAIEDDDNC